MTSARQQRAAVFLDAAARLVEEEPGLNVLDAFRRLRGSDEEIGDAYYALLHELESPQRHPWSLLAPWSDAETSDRVAHRCRRAAKELRGELRVIRRVGA